NSHNGFFHGLSMGFGDRPIVSAIGGDRGYAHDERNRQSYKQAFGDPHITAPLLISIETAELAVNRDCPISSLGSADTAQTRRSKICNSLRPSVAVERHSQCIHRQFGKHQPASALISSYHNLGT